MERQFVVGSPVGLRSGTLYAGLIVSTLLAVYFNAELVGRRFLEKLHMDWTPGDLSSADMVVTSACAVAGGLLATILFAGAGTLARKDGNRLVVVMGLTNLFLHGFTMWATVFARETLAAWVQELQPIGLAQELMIALATLLLGYAAWRARGVAPAAILGVPGVVVIGAMAAAVFLLLMEEISWGQHLVGWASPEAFSGNLQQETNFHNFYTNRFEFLYYSGAFAAFLVLPFVSQTARFAAPFRFYVPSVGFALAALPIVGFMSEDWGIVCFRIYFFCALGIAAHAAFKAAGTFRVLAIALLLAMILAQGVFLAYGHRLLLSTEIGEMRETAIAWAILAYCGWLTIRLRDVA